MSKVTFIIVFLCCLLAFAVGYGTTITRSTATTSSISDFYQDFSYCSCDVTPSLCDNYCCCDASCSSATTATWTSASSCLSSSSTIQSFCNDSSTKGFGSFQDLSCVYFSNRGTIGYFYNYPQTTSISYTTPTKFASKTPGTITSLFTAATTATLGTGYSTSNPYLQDTASSFFYAPVPGPGGYCVPGALNVTASSSTMSCIVAPTAQNCASINNLLSNTLCLQGNCTTSQNFAVQASSVSGSNCLNVLTGLTITYTISSTLSIYTLSSASIAGTYSTVALGSTSIATVTTAITTPATTSGNPGYQLGKAITITAPTTLFAMSDPATSTTCFATGSATGTTSILFGQSATYRCQSTSACTNTYYIDSLLTTTITIQQYASQSTSTITVTGTSANLNCNYQTYTLQIVYSYGGWQLDPQYYIVGAKIIPSFNPDSQTNPSTKYFTVSWVYVDPKTINTPPSNNFYQYFSYLWTPFKQRFGIN